MIRGGLPEEVAFVQGQNGAESEQCRWLREESSREREEYVRWDCASHVRGPKEAKVTGQVN